MVTLTPSRPLMQYEHWAASVPVSCGRTMIMVAFLSSGRVRCWQVLMDEPAAVEEAARVIGKGSVRLAVDSVGGDATATLVQMLSDRGVLVTYSAASGQPLAINELLLIGKHLTVKCFFLGDFDHVSKILPAQIEAAPLVASGALRVPVAAVYPMSKIKETVAHLLNGGKILIDVASASNG